MSARQRSKLCSGDLAQANEVSVLAGGRAALPSRNSTSWAGRAVLMVPADPCRFAGAVHFDGQMRGRMACYTGANHPGRGLVGGEIAF